MTGKKWTLSDAAGDFLLENISAGDHNLVTRKGFFRRQRTVAVVQNTVTDIPSEKTTLPGANSSDGLDEIPNYAVLLNSFDKPEDMLAKMGLGDLDTSGHLIQGSQQFHTFNDSSSGGASVGPSSMLFSNQDFLDYYHMVFFPCICSTLTASNNVGMLREYVENGGKIYSSCWASQWAEQPYPNVIEFNGDDNAYNAGDIGSWNSHGNIENPDMIDWLAVVAGGESPTYYPLEGGWILIDSLSFNSYDGHGALDDGAIGGPVVPTVWVSDVESNPGHPLTITYPYDCGKIFYSTYQVVESGGSTQIRAQEWILIYLFYEVGVCEGDYIPPE